MKTNLFSLSGKTAIVTGALGLLGGQHCRALAEAGANVVAADLVKGACEEFGFELRRESGTDSNGMACDITNPESLQALKAAVLEKYGQIDVLVNNAGVDDKFDESCDDIFRLEAYPLSHWRRMLEVNLTGTFLCCQVIGPEMVKRARGSIINIASTYGIVAPDQSIYRRPDGSQTFFKSPAYPATKAAVISLTRYLASCWGRSSVRVNSICPGGVWNSQEQYFIENYSERTPLGRMAKSDDYKGAIVFLACDASSYMTGANLVVDGGWTIW
ncbi:MAG TPA: SDR family oxidoreductase [Blastocatellia bacterium]|nr:SDR family oxidoreductase [Blastocatellia bacterium]